MIKRRFYGPEIHARPATPAYRDNYDKIFGPKERPEFGRSPAADLLEAAERRIGEALVPDSAAVLEPYPQPTGDLSRLVHLTREQFDQLAQVLNLALELAAAVNGDAYDKQLDDLIEFVGRGEGAPAPVSLLKFWGDSQGYVLEDMVAFVRDVLIVYGFGAKAEALLERLAKFTGEPTF